MNSSESSNSKMIEITVLLTAMNEAETLRELHERVTRRLRAMGRPYEMIFVDDGSSDASQDILRDLAEKDENTGYIIHTENLGKSVALMQGFDAARGEVLVTMDADLQDVPGNIRVLVDELEEGGYGLVSGLRFPRKDTKVKILISWVFNWLVRIFLGRNFHDVNSGMKAYSRDFYKKLELKSDLHRLIPAMAANEGFKVCEKPISHEPRRRGKSKYKLLRYRGILDIHYMMYAQKHWMTHPVFSILVVLALFAGLVLPLVHLSEYPCCVPSIAIVILDFAAMVLLAIHSRILNKLMKEEPKSREWREERVAEKRLPGGESGSP